MCLRPPPLLLFFRLSEAIFWTTGRAKKSGEWKRALSPFVLEIFGGPCAGFGSGVTNSSPFAGRLYLDFSLSLGKKEEENGEKENLTPRTFV